MINTGGKLDHAVCSINHKPVLRYTPTIRKMIVTSVYSVYSAINTVMSLAGGESWKGLITCICVRSCSGPFICLAARNAIWVNVANLRVDWPAISRAAWTKLARWSFVEK